ncbi:MAG: DNA repair protein RecO [Myxococcota bacterium]
MTASASILGFVLRKVDYGERDIIVTVFGRETGKFTAMAKSARGSKRRFGGGLQPMRCLRIDYRPAKSDGLAFLNSIEVEEDYRHLENDYECITLASYATELVRCVVQDNQPDQATFDLLRDLYRQLPDISGGLSAREVLLHHFELRLLSYHGAAPSVDVCFRCGKKVERFDKLRCARNGQGMLCGACYRPGEGTGILHLATLEALRYMREPDGDVPEGWHEPSVREQARRVIDASFAQLLDAPLKSKPMVDILLEEPG